MMESGKFDFRDEFVAKTIGLVAEGCTLTAVAVSGGSVPIGAASLAGDAAEIGSGTALKMKRQETIKKYAEKISSCTHEHVNRELAQCGEAHLNSPKAIKQILESKLN
jgi:hypothetical protein